MRLENIEYLRKQLPTTNLTKVTPETFAKWKQDRLARKQVSVIKGVEGQKEKEAAEKASEKKKVSSKEARLLSGRALFIYNPNLFVDDEGAADTAEYEVVDPEEEERNREGKGEEINIAEAAEKAAAEQAAAGIAENEEEVKISLTMFEDEDLGDLPSDEDETNTEPAEVQQEA